MSSLTYCALLSLFLVIADACMRVNPGNPGMPAMSCTSCTDNMITKTTLGDGSHAFLSDVTTTTGANGCLSRTFTCQGTNANIEINNMDGVVSDGDDGMVDMLAHFTVTCNAAGTAWQNSGIDITKVECASD